MELVPGFDYFCPKCPASTGLAGLFARNKTVLGIETNSIPPPSDDVVPLHSLQRMEYPGVAIGVLVFNHDGNILLGKRKGELGNGEYSLPGGKVDFGETPYQTAIREVKEETNLEFMTNPCDKLQFTGQVTNDYFPAREKHYITLYYSGTAANPEDLKVMEPDKIEEWAWYDWFNLPQPIWMHTGKLLQTVMTGAAFKNPDIDGVSPVRGYQLLRASTNYS